MIFYLIDKEVKDREMSFNTTHEKSEIYRLILRESELITAWVKSGDTPSAVYGKLRDKNPDIIFSKWLFI